MLTNHERAFIIYIAEFTLIGCGPKFIGPEVIHFRISDLHVRSLKLTMVHQRTDKSTLVMDSSAPLLYHDFSDLGSLFPIQINPKGVL